jgi:hypothetical protein
LPVLRTKKKSRPSCVPCLKRPGSVREARSAGLPMFLAYYLNFIFHRVQRNSGRKNTSKTPGSRPKCATGTSKQGSAATEKGVSSFTTKEQWKTSKKAVIIREN